MALLFRLPAGHSGGRRDSAAGFILFVFDDILCLFLTLMSAEKYHYIFLIKKKRMKKAFAVILFILFVFYLSIVKEANAQQKPLIIVFFEDFAPYSFIENGKITGVLHDSLLEILVKRMNVKVEVKAGPWVRMQELVETGKADAFCTNPTDERKKYAVPCKVPTVLPLYRVFINKNNNKLAAIKTVNNLEELRNAARANKFTISTYIGDGWAKANLEAFNVNIDYTRNLECTILKVAHKRADVVVNLCHVQRYSMRILKNKLSAQGKAEDAKKIAEIIELDTEIDTGKFHLCVSKKSPYLKLLGDFEKAMDQALNDGTVSAILKKYQ